MNPRMALRYTTALGLAVGLLATACSKRPTTPHVTLPDADLLFVSPDSATIRIGASFRFTVTALDSAGVAMSANLHFSSSDPGVFTVDGSGRVTGRGEGSAVMDVVSGAARDSAVVIVIATQNGWFNQISSVVTTLNGVFFLADGRHGWVVGDGGKILRTFDGGNSWSAVVSGSSATLASVWFTTPTQGWVVGSGGTVLHSTDGGTNWSRLLNVGTTENLSDVWFATPDTGWAVGTHGLIASTFDGGASWRRTNPTGFDLNSVSFAGTRDGWAVGDNGLILGTHDHGASWYMAQPPVISQPLRSVWRASLLSANAVGAAGVTFRTVASADSAAWQAGNAGSLYDLNGVCFPTAAIGFAVGYNAGGATLRSDDGGASWQLQLPHTSSRLKDVFFVDVNRGWAVDETGVIVHTVTGGQP